jgi:quercetin dioxygenase-like cupin family protein
MKLTGLDQIPQEAVSHNPAIKKQVMLRLGDLPHLTNFSQARFAPGQVAKNHHHEDMAEVFFVEAGRGTITIDGTPYALVPGVCVAVEPGECHEVVNDGEQELVLTYFGLRVNP